MPSGKTRFSVALMTGFQTFLLQVLILGGDEMHEVCVGVFGKWTISTRGLFER